MASKSVLVFAQSDDDDDDDEDTFMDDYKYAICGMNSDTSDLVIYAMEGNITQIYSQLPHIGKTCNIINSAVVEIKCLNEECLKNIIIYDTRESYMKTTKEKDKDV